jgi:hypothetical protein
LFFPPHHQEGLWAPSFTLGWWVIFVGVKQPECNVKI